MRSSASARYGIPGASYRLQLDARFGFEQAQRLIPYLEELGVTHLYFSPIFAAAAGSTHGYDVLDHSKVNPELGGLGGLYALGEELLGRGLGLILDIVPNHVGVAAGANPWWRSVLRYGQASPYSGYFDIDWEAQPQLPRGVLVFPMLGQPFGKALEAGELQLALRDGDIVLAYYEHSLSLRPESYSSVLGLPPLSLRDELNDPLSLPALAEALDDLSFGEVERSDAALQRLRTLLLGEPALAKWVEDSCASLNGTPGDSHSFDRLDEIIGEQHYRPADWRLAGSEINYRRFFDQNGLAAIRVEREDVFRATHGLLFDLVAQGIVTGIRVDHLDGLYDPAGYLSRLQAGLDEATAGIPGANVPIFVEKILAMNEELPGEWPVAGTTGYEVGAHVDRLFVDSAAAREMGRAYENFAGRQGRFEELRYTAKRYIAQSAFAGEISVLAYQLHRIAKRHRLFRDIPLRSLREAIEATVASFPVYRTYLSGRPAEDTYIVKALEAARRRRPQLSDAALAFLREVLLLEGLEPASEEWESRAHFRRRMEQITGPVVAKGLEDTAFFRYNRLISLNEVGGDPALFGETADDAHRWFASRARDWPAAMCAGSTHDAKRAEDVRARISVLSEIPMAWRRESATWGRLNERHKTTVDGEPVPSGNLEYYLYQTIVGSWPLEGPTTQFRERLHEHLTKAMREAKLETSWTSPNDRYESAAHDFLKSILDSRRARGFQRRVGEFVAALLPAASIHALSGLLIRGFAPGFPDLYQGTEVYYLALTDPDNRQPVDFANRWAMLRAVRSRAPLECAFAAPEWKMWLTHIVLETRQRHAAYLREPAYAPVEVTGARAGHLFSFARGEDRGLVVVAPRLTRAMVDAAGVIRPERWEDTRIRLPGSGRWANLLDGQVLEGEDVSVAELLRVMPFAVLERS